VTEESRVGQAGPSGGPAAARPAPAAVILTAAGEGPEEPWAFAEVLGRTLLGLCAETVDGCPGIEGFVVVAPAGMEDRVAGATRSSGKFLAAVRGGSTAIESLAPGIAALPPRFEAVVWHDAGRPLASRELFTAVLRALDGADVAVPQVPVGDTVKRVDGGVVGETIPRDGLAVLQSPQAFRREALAAVIHARGEDQQPAKGALLSAATGLRVATVPGDPGNVPVRTLRDVRLVEELLAGRLSRSDGR
jgi:2-C-methyl-D-erythritol 4-phosphate cytidylyltransferase / 2-C-methyl-D-erythritol 2,4-cyclodiphosphate synthase